MCLPPAACSHCSLGDQPLCFVDLLPPEPRNKLLGTRCESIVPWPFSFLFSFKFRFQLYVFIYWFAYCNCLVMISLMHKPLHIFIVYCWMNLNVLPQSRKTRISFPTTIDITQSQSKNVPFPSSSGIMSLELHRPILTILRPEDSDPPSTLLTPGHISS